MDAIRRNALRQPQIVGFVIAGYPVFPSEDGDVEPVFGKTEPLRGGHQFPGVSDGVALEVVAKTEIAQHFKEGVVAASETDIFKIIVLAACAYALLGAGRPSIVAVLDSKKHILELVHARVGEEQSPVVGGNQRGGVHPAVPLQGEKTQKGFPYVGTRAVLHGSSLVHFLFRGLILG